MVHDALYCVSQKMKMVHQLIKMAAEHLLKSAVEEIVELILVGLNTQHHIGSFV